MSPTKGGEIERVRRLAMARHSIGKAVAQKLTSSMLAMWRDERLREVSPGTVIRELGLLRRVMQIAVNEAFERARERSLKALQRCRDVAVDPEVARLVESLHGLVSYRNPTCRSAIFTS